MIEKLLKLLKIKFSGDVMLKDGTPLIISGDLGIGVKVQIQGPDGIIDLPDGSYELETGQIITVADGVITDIVDQVNTPENPDTPTGVPDASTPDGEVVISDAKDSGTTESTTPATPTTSIDDLSTKIKELEDKIKILEDKTSKLSEETTKFNSDMDTLKNKTILTKELSKNQTPELSVNSELVDKINNFKKLKK